MVVVAVVVVAVVVAAAVVAAVVPLYCYIVFSSLFLI